MTDRLALPVRPAPPDPPAFPLVGALAPLIVAAVLFAALRTPTVLLFAVFSPVLAVAGVLDGRLQMRRRLRRDTARHAAALETVEREVDARRAADAAELHRRSPTPAALVGDPARWSGRPPTGRLVLGVADRAVQPLVSGTPSDPRERALVALGSTLPAVPVVVDGATTVAVVGPPLLAQAFARAVGVAALRATGVASDPPVLESASGASADLVIAIGADSAAHVVHASGPADDLSERTFTPCFVTRPQRQALQSSGGSARLDRLLASPAGGAGLAARFLVDADGPMDVDLVGDGPHAVVVGTTGSGKSALLTAWVLALAAAHPPERLTLLLVDCKGGAAFDPLADLPHVAGVVTDLDPAGTERAVDSLAAELRRRERALRDARATDVAAAGIGRLVVVVDEYRALLDSRPALADLFADVAARGRSLGVHLVLCTQRATGAVRDELLANCGLRISLRVHDARDSIAVVGTDQAARLGRDPIGAAIVRVQGERTRLVRVAEVDGPLVTAAVRSVVASAATAPAAATAARRPWLPPLPHRLELPAAEAGSVALGRLDLPAEQRQPALHWDPARHPRLLVIGDAGSGRTGALAAVAHGLGTTASAATPAGFWDRLHDDGRPLIVDDVDHLLDRLGEAHVARAVERLAERLRSPAAAPTVLALRGPTAWAGLPLRGLVGLFDELLLLRLGIDDHLSMGGERSAWSADLLAGGGWWRGRRAQIGIAPALGHDRVAVPPVFQGGPAVLVTGMPAERRTRLEAAGYDVRTAEEELPPGSAVVLVGSPAAWQARWQALGRLAALHPVLIDGVSAAEVRALLGKAVALPPVDDPDDVLLVPTEGAPIRVRLPSSGLAQSGVRQSGVSAR